jgi:hypothetical protein
MGFDFHGSFSFLWEFTVDSGKDCRLPIQAKKEGEFARRGKYFRPRTSEMLFASLGLGGR